MSLSDINLTHERTSQYVCACMFYVLSFLNVHVYVWSVIRGTVTSMHLYLHTLCGCTIGAQRCLYRSTVRRGCDALKERRRSTLLVNNSSCVLLYSHIRPPCREKSLPAGLPSPLQHLCVPTPITRRGAHVTAFINVLVQVLGCAHSKHGCTCLQSTNMLTHTQKHNIQTQMNHPYLLHTVAPRPPAHTPLEITHTHTGHLIHHAIALITNMHTHISLCFLLNIQYNYC